MTWRHTEVAFQCFQQMQWRSSIKTGGKERCSSGSEQPIRFQLFSSGAFCISFFCTTLHCSRAIQVVIWPRHRRKPQQQKICQCWVVGLWETYMICSFLYKTPNPKKEKKGARFYYEKLKGVRLRKHIFNCPIREFWVNWGEKVGLKKFLLGPESLLLGPPTAYSLSLEFPAAGHPLVIWLLKISAKELTNSLGLHLTNCCL